MTGESINDNGGSNEGAEKQRSSGFSQGKLLQKAREIVEDRTKDWEMTSPKAEERIPRFYSDGKWASSGRISGVKETKLENEFFCWINLAHRRFYRFCPFLEIELAGVLGKGGFFVVSEVKNITLQHFLDGDDDPTQGESSESPCEDENYIQGVVQNRKFMARHCLRNGKHPRYALKTMQEVNRQDENTFINSVVDMAIEFKFLSAVRHPNIIKMRAASVGDLYQPNAFLILDRIYDTLTDRIEKWKKKEQNAFNRFFDFQKKREKHFLAKRLLVSFDIASAMAYLHDMK